VLGAVVLLAALTDASQEAPLSATIERLRASDIGTDGGTDVPAEAADLLSALKRGVRERIVAVVAAPEALRAPPEALRAAVVRRLLREGVVVGWPDDPYPLFGNVVDVSLWTVPEQPGWLLASTTVSLPCGSDTSVYVFRRSRGGYAPLLDLEANGYRSIDAAQGGLRVFVAPGADPYLVTLEVPPWCTSCWLGLRYRVIRPGPNPETPKVLFARRVSAYDCGADSTVRAFSDSFGLGYWDFTNAEDHHGPFFLRHTLSGDHVVAQAPIVLSLGAWLESWASKDWSLAAGDVAPAARKAARAWHAKLHARPEVCFPRGEQERFVPESADSSNLAVRYTCAMEQMGASLDLTFEAVDGRFVLAWIADRPGRD